MLRALPYKCLLQRGLSFPLCRELGRPCHPTIPYRTVASWATGDGVMIILSSPEPPGTFFPLFSPGRQTAIFIPYRTVPYHTYSGTRTRYPRYGRGPIMVQSFGGGPSIRLSKLPTGPLCSTFLEGRSAGAAVVYSFLVLVPSSVFTWVIEWIA